MPKTDLRDANAGIDYKFYASHDYYREIAAQIATTVAGDRVVLTSMTFSPEEPAINRIMTELTAASSRGVNATLIVDAYSFLSNDNNRPMPLLIKKNLPKKPRTISANTLAVLKNFKLAGGRYTIINIPTRALTLIYAGRCHVKLAIINDRVYVGGCNLSDSVRVDMMVGWNDKFTADQLVARTNRIFDIGNSRLAMNGRDVDLKLTEDTQLLIDAGVPGQSLIMAKALELIDQAEDTVFIACQYFPNSVTTKYLVRAHKRGVKVTILHNHPSQHGRVHGLLHKLVILRERVRTPSILMKDQIMKDQPFMHCKLIATEKAAIMGSHNYVTAGVNFGTTEIALLRYDAEFAKQAIQHLMMQLS